MRLNGFPGCEDYLFSDPFEVVKATRKLKNIHVNDNCKKNCIFYLLLYIIRVCWKISRIDSDLF